MVVRRNANGKKDTGIKSDLKESFSCFIVTFNEFCASKHPCRRIAPSAFFAEVIVIRTVASVIVFIVLVFVAFVVGVIVGYEGRDKNE